MPDTKSAATSAGTSPERRDFAEAMHDLYVAKDGYAASKRKILITPALLLAGGAVLGGAARMLPPAWATTVTGTLATLIGAFAIVAVWASFHGDPLRGVDWATADDYEQHLTAGLHPDATAALARTQDQVRRRFPGARVHVYRPDRLPEHPCTLDISGCDCAGTRFNAAVLPNRHHPIIVVGDQLLEQPAALAYVLAHETNHVRRPWLQLTHLLAVVTFAGWPGMGLLLPWHTLMVVAPAVWAATMLLQWINEFASDIAARTTGPDAARHFWTIQRAARPTRTGLSRLTGAITAVLAPTHPPMALRAALAERTAHRPSLTQARKQ